MDGVWIKVDGEWVKATTGSQAEIEAHTNDAENPHKVTKEQIGLGDVKNVEQASKSELELHKKSTGHITDIERDQWNKKETPEGAQEKADGAFEKASGHMEEVLELYETKESAVSKLDEAKEYTDEAIKEVDLSELTEEISVHREEVASTEGFGHVMIGEGLDITDGVLSLFKQANFKLEKGLNLSGLKPSDLAPVGFTVGLAEKDYISEITKYHSNFFGDAVAVLEHYELDKFAKLTIYGWEAMLTIAYDDDEWEYEWSYQTVNLGDGLEFDRYGRLSASISHIHLEEKDSWNDYERLDVPNGWTLGTAGHGVGIPGIEDWNFDAFLLIYTFNSYQMAISINGLGDYWINHFNEGGWRGWKKLGVDTSKLATKKELEEHKTQLATSEEAGHVTLSDWENGYDSSHGVALAPKALSRHSERLGGSGAHGHVKLSDWADASRGSDSGWAATPKAVAEGLDEAKSYTNEEIAKIPDVKDTVDTVNNYKTRIKVDSNRSTIMIGPEVFNPPLYYLQVGKVLSANSGSAKQREGSVNICSLNPLVSNNTIHHNNAMVFGCGIETLSESNKPFGNERAITYIGQYNKQPTDSNTMFLVGIGSGATKKKTGMRMDSFGDLMVNGQYKTSGADYAEMFEWEDKNIENIDRVALAVTWGEGESIKLANAGDEIIGIVSATAAVLGDNPDEWDKRFVTDQFGRPLRKEYTEVNENGEEEIYEWFVENPEYDKDTPYIPRSERSEWDAIGLVGKLYWIDDGTLEVGDYATVGENGVATKGTKENGYRVMKRISKNTDGKSGVVKVFFK